MRKLDYREKTGYAIPIDNRNYSYYINWRSSQRIKLIHHHPKTYTKLIFGQNRSTSYKSKGKIRCHGGVSKLCWPVTSAVSFLTKLGNEIARRQTHYENDSLARVWNNHLTYICIIYHHITHVAIICNRKQSSCRRLCKMMTWEKTRYPPVTSLLVSLY
jgi:hypothetical protein